MSKHTVMLRLLAFCHVWVHRKHTLHFYLVLKEQVLKWEENAGVSANDRPDLSSERVPHTDRTVTFNQNVGLDTKTDRLTDCQSQSDSDSGVSRCRLVSFLVWGETESTWYVGHCLACCTNLRW
jgi:hypothetical protein